MRFLFVACRCHTRLAFAVRIFMADSRNIVTAASVAVALIAGAWAIYATHRAGQSDRLNAAEAAQVAGSSRPDRPSVPAVPVRARRSPASAYVRAQAAGCRHHGGGARGASVQPDQCPRYRARQRSGGGHVQVLQHRHRRALQRRPASAERPGARRAGWRAGARGSRRRGGRAGRKRESGESQSRAALHEGAIGGPVRAARGHSEGQRGARRCGALAARRHGDPCALRWPGGHAARERRQPGEPRHHHHYAR